MRKKNDKTESSLAVQLAEIECQLLDSRGLDNVRIALESSNLSCESIGLGRLAFAWGNPTVETPARFIFNHFQHLVDPDIIGNFEHGESW